MFNHHSPVLCLLAWFIVFILMLLIIIIHGTKHKKYWCFQGANQQMQVFVSLSLNLRIKMCA